MWINNNQPDTKYNPNRNPNPKPCPPNKENTVVAFNYIFTKPQFIR